MPAKYIAAVVLFKLVEQADSVIDPALELNRVKPSTGGLFFIVTALIVALTITSCDNGLVVPEEERAGAIAGTITYVHGGAFWPQGSEIFDIRFVAMRFVPTDTADFLQLNRMEISNTLRFNASTDTFFIGDVAPGAFPYSGVAYRYSQDIFDWKPVGVYSDNDGMFTVENGETTQVSIVVDFLDPPTFPPEF
ncbi:MAG TPA: hypothetical protein VMO47_18525 [Rhodothermales bacterium]|nr:hypothetical protein [Rhodothermales bacterium]